MDKKILIIDDELEILEALKLILESKGFKVSTMSNFNNPWSVSKFMPDLILLDLLIGGQAGQTIAKSIHSNEGTKKIPIVIISAQPIQVLRSAAMECKAVNYLQKPFNILDLLTVVNQTLKS